MPARPYQYECAIDRIPHSEIGWPVRGLAKIRWIVIHRCDVRTASEGKFSDSLADTARYFMGQPYNWQGHPYCFQVDPGGSVYQTARLSEITNGVRGFNTWSLHIKCSGNFTIEPPTRAQFQAAAALCADLSGFLLRDGNAVKIKGHTELVPIRPKRCPGRYFEMPSFRKLSDRMLRGERNGVMFEPTDLDWFRV